MGRIPDLFYGIYASLVSGLGYGLIISLLAAGLSLIYGIMGTVNTSHGSFYMFGGVLSYFAAIFLKLNPLVAIAFSVVVSFCLGMVVLSLTTPSRMWVTKEGSEQSTVMILLAGAAIVMQQVAFLLFGGSAFIVPSMAGGYILLPGGVYITNQVLASMIIAVLTYGLLVVFLKYTKMGMGLRAYSQNKEVAEALGVAGKKVSLLSFAIGVSMASLAGGLLASVYTINASTGWNELITAFIIVTFGGIGSIAGSLVGGLIYGVAYSVLQFYYPSLSFVIVLLIIYIIILVRPTGLFGQVVDRG